MLGCAGSCWVGRDERPLLRGVLGGGEGAWYDRLVNLAKYVARLDAAHLERKDVPSLLLLQQHDAWGGRGVADDSTGGQADGAEPAEEQDRLLVSPALLIV